MTSFHPEILLVAVNARYSHCSYTIRSLQANLGRFSQVSQCLEVDLGVQPLQLASQIVDANPRIVSFSIYLWNVRIVESTVAILRAIAPHIRLVAGGPEITPDYLFAKFFDAIVVGEGESSFRMLCERWLPASTDVETKTRPSRADSAGSRELAARRENSGCETVVAPPENLVALALPYHLYTETDLDQRTVYVEASRGCPYACAYCTSANTGLRLIPLDRLLPAFDDLWKRGLRRFKFLDRSFNAPVDHAAALLDFFLARVAPSTRLHFEINPDRIHEKIASRIAAFPKDALHLEVGIQTLNPSVAAAIGRSPDTADTLANVHFLTHCTQAVVHADLIFGLPGEDEASFASGFNALVSTCNPAEVQVNLLKILPGTRFAHEAKERGLEFNHEPPYEVLRTDSLDFVTLMNLQCFARCWELVHNRNRFPNAVRVLHAVCNGEYYWAYKTLAFRIHNEEGKFFAIGLPRLGQYLRAHLVENFGVSAAEADRLIDDDLNGKKPCD